MINTANDGRHDHAMRVFPKNPWTKFFFSKKKTQPKNFKPVLWYFGGMLGFKIGCYYEVAKEVFIGIEKGKRIMVSPKGAIWCPLPRLPVAYEEAAKEQLKEVKDNELR